MKYFIKLFSLLLLACVWCISCIDDNPEIGTVQLKQGDTLPLFSVKMNDGQTVTNESLKDKPSVIVFFNTGCKDCQQELPVLQSVFEAYPQINWVCISREEKEESIETFWTKQGLTLPYSAQEDRIVYYLFAKSGIPQIFIVGKNGMISNVFSDFPLATYNDLVAAIEASL